MFPEYLRGRCRKSLLGGMRGALIIIYVDIICNRPVWLRDVRALVIESVKHTVILDGTWRGISSFTIRLMVLA